MDAQDIQYLERETQALIQAYERIKEENSKLRNKCYKLKREQEALQVKNQEAIHKIKQMISRLKTIEAQS